MKNKILKDWQNRKKGIDELHHDSVQWISEIDFIKDEIRFLEHMLQSKYIDCLSAGLYKKVENLVKKMSEEKKVAKTLKLVVQEQEAILSNLIKTESVSSNINFLDNHRKLELEMNLFMVKYKRIKKQIFEIIGNVMKQKGQKKLV